MNKLLALASSLLIAACGTAPDSASAVKAGEGRWCHNDKELKATNGVVINYDYLVVRRNTHGNNLAYAEPGWINVRNGNFTGRESARAVVINYYSHSRCAGCLTEDGVQEIDLKYDANERKFTAEVPSLLMYHYTDGSNMSYMNTYEFAVVIDGQWLALPNGSHNFRFAPWQHARYECQR